MNFLTTPLNYTRDQRTSRDVCRDACAIESFATRKRMPSYERSMYLVAVVALLVIAVLA